MRCWRRHEKLHHRGTEDHRVELAVQMHLAFDARRRQIAEASIIRAPVFRAASAEELDQLFTAAQARGNEGLMIKDLDPPIRPGKRGKSWLKMKRELATLDVVVTAVEYGHGKRIGVLSDYTFAVWDGDRLVNIGKAYSGLTDVEIAEMTKWFLEHTRGRSGIPAHGRAEDRAGSGVQQHDGVRAARERVRAALSADRAPASG